jgi:hypothetical protein
MVDAIDYPHADALPSAGVETLPTDRRPGQPPARAPRHFPINPGRNRK